MVDPIAPNKVHNSNEDEVAVGQTVPLPPINQRNFSIQEG